MNRAIKTYLPIIFLIVCLGLPTRTIAEHLPTFYVQYVGDALWAMMLFFLFALLLKRKSGRFIFIATMLFTWGIEFTQFYHAEWIDGLRRIKIFALLLGHRFLVSDLMAYTVGILLAYGIDSKISATTKA